MRDGWAFARSARHRSKSPYPIIDRFPRITSLTSSGRARQKRRGTERNEAHRFLLDEFAPVRCLASSIGGIALVKLRLKVWPMVAALHGQRGRSSVWWPNWPESGPHSACLVRAADLSCDRIGPGRRGHRVIRFPSMNAARLWGTKRPSMVVSALRIRCVVYWGGNRAIKMSHT
jgi:hypothetical protein